ncbi:MAG: histidine phosphatase family protein [Tissierellia bacterium]|nr:histidine phosphatase family protein [Tissierellia bacterium]
MDIILIRHGETDANREKVFSLDSTPLTDSGLEQMRNASKLLAEYHYKKVLISEYLRTKLSFEAMNIDKEYIVDERLNEFNYGVLKGNSVEESLVKYEDIFNNWYKNNMEYRIPGGESIADLYLRVCDIYEELVEKDEDILIITHDGVIRSFLCAVFKTTDIYYKFKIDNGSVTVINIKDGYPVLAKFNLT